MLAFSECKAVFIRLKISLRLAAGCFIETIAAITFLSAILVLFKNVYRFNLVHIGIIMATTRAIGFVTPRLGLNLFIGASISAVSAEKLSTAIIPLLIAMVVALILAIFVPQLSLTIL